MHADEAVNADKVGTLLEHGRYEYSSVEFHGPTLYYAAFVFARLHGLTEYHDLNEVVLRMIPAILGVLLVAAHFWLIPYLGLPASACAALFTAVSPPMVYYSRYFIHETLLVFFTFCALLAVLEYIERPGAVLALAVGALFGLMYATKETWIVAAAAMLVACLVGRPHPAISATLEEGRPGGRPRTRGSAPLQHVIIAAFAFLAVAMVFLSSFLTHPRGIVDSVLAYGTYFARGVGVHTAHVHPWYFYFACLRGEALIGALALVGLLAYRTAVPSRGRSRAMESEQARSEIQRPPDVPFDTIRFLKIYTVLMVAIYSAIPYKAPWNVLSFWHATILLAAMGVAWMAQHAPKVLMIALVMVAACEMGWQARALSFECPSAPGNPWVYAHTGTDVFVIVKQVRALAAVYPGGRAIPIQIFTHENLWPLPWYFRKYPNVRWWNGVSDAAPLAPVILATPDMEAALLHRIYEVPPPGHREMYVNMFDHYVELRPSVEVRGYAAKSLWDDLR